MAARQMFEHWVAKALLIIFGALIADAGTIVLKEPGLGAKAQGDFCSVFRNFDVLRWNDFQTTM